MNETIMASIVENEIDRLERYNQSCPVLSKYSRNLNLLALQERIDKVYGRDTQIQQIMRIMLRKTKSNAILTGLAGCGKTAIAEGLAYEIATSRVEHIAKHYDDTTPTPELLFGDYVIYDLSMNSLISGSRYRGDFEERMQNILDEISKHSNIIVFIDEIHQINEIGNSEGSTNMGQILKPALARGDIRIIGATTTEEYKYIKRDKALARRFCEIVIPELTGETALKCFENIVLDYGKYHKVNTEKIDCKAIMETVAHTMPKSVFPNNVIDIIDETFASARFDGKEIVTMEDINKTISRITGHFIN
jgi:ATP-dependent Clp protease ATP-binding subunit ClpA